MSPDPIENDRLWQLLDQAPPSVLPRDFTSRVVSSVEALESGRRESHFVSRLPQHLFKSVAGAIVVILLSLAFWLTNPPRDKSEEDQIVSTLSGHELIPSDLFVVTRLNELLEAEIASLWTENQ